MKDQGDLFMRAPYSNPTTSRAAAQQIEPVSGTQRAVLLDYLRAHGPATDDELKLALGWESNTENPRRGELVKLGLIEDSGETRPTRKGRQAIVWRAK